MTTWRALAASAVALSGCSRASTPPVAKGHLVVALTIDWEGADLSADGLAALDDLRRSFGAVPLTHFVSSAYFTKASRDPEAVTTLAHEVRTGDELAVHLHLWRSLAAASGVAPKLSPSFLTGTDEVLAFEDGDAGFDTDLDVYSVPELRQILRASRALLQQTRIPISTTFRAGGYLGTPKVLEAIHDEGYTVDSSAIDYRPLDKPETDALSGRVRELWPSVTTATQPFFVHPSGGPLLEMPIAAVADYANAAELVGIFDRAHAELQKAPDRDVFVVLGFHLETAAEFAPRLTDAMKTIGNRRHELVDEMIFVTVEKAAVLARARRAPAT